MNIKCNDLVIVISGNHKSTKPVKVTAVFRSDKKVAIDGVGGALRHVKRGHPKSPQGGRLQIPVAFSFSKVALFCSTCASGVRTHSRLIGDIKTRCCIKCDNQI